MSHSSTLIARIREALDVRHALALLKRAISIPSVTRDETNFAAGLKGETRRSGREAIRRICKRKHLPRRPPHTPSRMEKATDRTEGDARREPAQRMLADAEPASGRVGLQGWEDVSGRYRLAGALSFKISTE